MKIIKDWAGVVALVAIIFTSFVASPASFGSSANGGNVTNFDAVSVLDGYYINDVLGFDADLANFGLLTEGGGVVTLTPVTSSITMTEANLLAGNVFNFTASSTQAALTVTLPATSTMTTFLPNAGDMHRFVIENSFLGAATTTTIAAGAGIDLQEPDGQNVVIGINNYAWFTCFREASTDVVCSVDETIPAD